MAQQKKQWGAPQYRNYAIFSLLVAVAFAVVGSMKGSYTSLYDYFPFFLAALFALNCLVGIYYYNKLK